MADLYLDGVAYNETDSHVLGDQTVSGDQTVTGAINANGDITNASGALTINPATYTRIGDAGSSSEGMGADDFFCSADVEITGTLHCKNHVKIGTNKNVAFGNSKIEGDTSADQLLLGLAASEGTQLVITHADNIALDHGHAAATDPVTYFHDSLDPTGAGATHWGSLTFNQTDFVISLGSGTVRTTGPASYTPDAITATSETVAASVATVVTEITTNGDSDLDDVSLANGVDGQIKIFAVVAVGNAADSVKITPASMIGGTQITFAANPLGLGCQMVYDAGAGGWIVTGNNGGTIA